MARRRLHFSPITTKTMEPCDRFEGAPNSLFPCFFCNGLTDKCENNSHIRLSLSKILNYLQLFPPDGKEKKLNYPWDEKFSTLSICEHCSEMAGEFSELYHLLEVTEMRLIGCLDRMQEVMTETEAEHETTNSEKKKKDDLRIATIGRIQEISKLPHVALRSRSQIVPTSTATAVERLDVEECKEERAVIPPELQLQPETGSRKGREHVKRKRKKNKKDRKTRTSTKSDSSNSKQKQILIDSCSSPTKTCKFCGKAFTHVHVTRRHMMYHCPDGPKLALPGDGSKLTCAYCSYECPSRQDRMKDHLIRRHPEMFFQSEKNNSSEWQRKHFKSILKEVVFPSFILVEEGSTTSPSCSCSCSICGKKCSSKNSFSQNRSVMTAHLMKNHLEEAREYLREILDQSDESLQETYYLVLHKQKQKSILNS